jgi:hypothetical protein
MKLRAKMFDDLIKARVGNLARSRTPRVYLGIVLTFTFISYSGLFCATAFVTLLPFEALAILKIAPPSLAYWIVITFVLTGETVLLIALIVLLTRNFKRGNVVSIDILVGSIGIALAVLLICYIYISGNIPLLI